MQHEARGVLPKAEHLRVQRLAGSDAMPERRKMPTSEIRLYDEAQRGRGAHQVVIECCSSTSSVVEGFKFPRVSSAKMQAPQCQGPKKLDQAL